MNFQFSKKIILVLVMTVFFSGLSSPFVSAAVPAKAEVKLPKGVTLMQGQRYPVYLFEPADFQSAKSPAILVLASDNPLKAIKKWSGLATQNNMLAVAPELHVRDEDVSKEADEWFLKLKKDVWLRYGVNRFFLIGEGTKAHYACYLGLQYPDEYSAIGAIGGSWVGPFEQMTKESSKEKKHIPFFIAMKQDDANLKATQEKTKSLQAKGYTIQLAVMDKPHEDSSTALKTALVTWLQAQVISVNLEGVVAADAADTSSKPQSKFRAKVSQIVDDFFRV